MSETQESLRDDILQPGTSGEKNQYLLRATCTVLLSFCYTLFLFKPSDPFKCGSL